LTPLLLPVPQLQLRLLHSLLQMRQMQQQVLRMEVAATWQLAHCSSAAPALALDCSSATACALIAMQLQEQHLAAFSSCHSSSSTSAHWHLLLHLPSLLLLQQQQLSWKCHWR
jgi:hypothetical protein